MKNIGASVDAFSTQEKEKNINEEKNKEYEAILDRVRTFIFFKNMIKKIKETERHKEEYANMEKIIREGTHSETREKYTLGVRARFGVSFQYFEISKHEKFDDECVYVSRKFFFLKNLITDDEKEEIEKFENNILNKFYYGK